TTIICKWQFDQITLQKRDFFFIQPFLRKSNHFVGDIHANYVIACCIYLIGSIAIATTDIVNFTSFFKILFHKLDNNYLVSVLLSAYTSFFTAILVLIQIVL